MTERTDLTRYLNDFAGKGDLQKAVADAIAAIAVASIDIAAITTQGALAGVTGQTTGDANADGDAQKDLDVRSDILVRNALANVRWSALASEEAAGPDVGDPQGLIEIAFDPLDGSSNIETNMSVGTIFTILPSQPGKAPFSAPGTAQIAAGFVVYGPQTSLVLSVGNGVDIFTLDSNTGSYLLVRSNARIPNDSAEYAINSSNYRHWEAPVRRYIDDCIAGKDGALGKNYNMRWNGSLVAEVYRILARGGVFLYPADARSGYEQGRLRLLYEALPMAFIVEQAGGRATTGRQRLLEVSTTAVHQRVPLILGSTLNVDCVDAYHQDGGQA